MLTQTQPNQESQPAFHHVLAVHDNRAKFTANRGVVHVQEPGIYFFK